MSVTQWPQYIHEWARELLGARGYIQAMNNSTDRRKLEQIAEGLASGAIDFSKARAVFSRASIRRQGLDQVYRELESPEVMTTAHGATAAHGRSAPAYSAVPSSHASPSTAPPRKVTVASEESVTRIQGELEAVRRHAREMENLLRELVQRAVMDATRIQGLETVVMAMAQNAGLGPACEETYANSTGDFLRRRMHLIRR